MTFISVDLGFTCFYMLLLKLYVLDRDVMGVSIQWSGRSQINALLTICPGLDPNTKIILTGGNDILLAPSDWNASTLGGGVCWDTVQTKFPHMNEVRRWGRLNLPNGQIARSLYSETQ